MGEKLYTIILNDGTKISNLKMNGNNFISHSPINPKIFEYNMSTITIQTDEKKETYNNMKIIHFAKINDEYWFAVGQISETEQALLAMQSEIDYIKMMTDLE